MRTLHPCQFNFQDKDIRRVGSTTSGGTSLSGIRDDIESTGGGYWLAEFTNGRTRTREAGLAWRERLFQPVGVPITVPHSDDTPFSDDTEYLSGGTTYYTAAAAPLRATTLTITGVSELPLIGGERFTIVHTTWGCRAYSIIGIEGDEITIRPPLREAIGPDTPLDFENVRCQMRLAQATGNPTNIGRYTSCNLTMIEDMRKPL
jgi:hypothetical protein